jgi:hypothetical protein
MQNFERLRPGVVIPLGLFAPAARTLSQLDCDSAWLCVLSAPTPQNERYCETNQGESSDTEGHQGT